MIAIDPGINGGIALQRSTKGVGTVEAFHMPKSESGLLRLLEDCKTADALGEIAFLEELVKYTGRNMPSSSMAVYAKNYGLLQGILMALNWDIIIVPPKQWQKALELKKIKGTPQAEWKRQLKRKAEELYPNIAVTLATADALLILHAAKALHINDLLTVTS